MAMHQHEIHLPPFSQFLQVLLQALFQQLMINPQELNPDEIGKYPRSNVFIQIFFSRSISPKLSRFTLFAQIIRFNLPLLFVIDKDSAIDTAGTSSESSSQKAPVLRNAQDQNATTSATTGTTRVSAFAAANDFLASPGQRTSVDVTSLTSGRSGASTSSAVTGQQRKSSAVTGGLSSPATRVMTSAATTASPTATGNVGEFDT